MNYYTNNPLIHRDRRVANSDSAWVKQFDCTDVRPLIICRGPIRKEAMDVFVEMGIEHYGILLSEKDSIVYTNALAPELRLINNPDHVHRVPDYTGATKEERQERIKQIIQIAKENGYNSIYTGYGFMAEDEEMVASMESAGLNFIGPCSRTVRDAGLKDEAKRTALRVGVSVTPGIDNATTLTLLKKYPTVQKLKALAKSKKLKVAVDLDSNDVELEDKAGAILDASYDAGIDLYTIDELGDCIQENVEAMFAKYPGNRLRLKAIGGGGGKGQRILLAPSSFTGSASEKAKKAAANAPSLVREILNEVKTTGVGDNKNVLIELNIETTRHQEIQVVGNGDWCITMGGRDCSLQMHEQKLLEVSVVHEDLVNTLEEAQSASNAAEAKVLKQDIKTLAAMEEEAATFGQAVGLDSVSTFECIVDRDMHFFMEMNTRIQVEHRVTELCYGLTFTNPQDPTDSFNVESLVELMVLLARHGKYLPKPTRYLRNPASVEARLNATNQALRPHAGGVINKWSDPIEGEIRDDQGICIHNPDTDVFMKYRLAGAYDSNVALILNVGSKRLETYQRLSNIIRSTVLQGTDLQTNLQFHYGLVNWFIGNNINARPTTRFIVPYLTLVGRLKQQVGQLHWDYLFERVSSDLTDGIKDADVLAATKDALQSKRSLLLRPLKALCEEPHVLSGWLSVHKKDFDIKSGKVIWHRNPLEVLADTYHFLNMDACDQAPAADVIWGHDQQILSQGLAFYDALTKKVKITDFAELDECISDKPAAKLSASKWAAIQSSHVGYQLGLELINALVMIADSIKFYSLKVNKDLTINIPDALTDEQLQADMNKVLVPPPAASGDEILAVSGGMFYSREAPGMNPFVSVGDHFEAGEPLYIVEVMKMFNRVNAPFSGTIEKTLIDLDGAIISKGQPLFKIVPDEKVVIETEEEVYARQTAFTDKLLKKMNK